MPRSRGCLPTPGPTRHPIATPRGQERTVLDVSHLLVGHPGIEKRSWPLPANPTAVVPNVATRLCQRHAATRGRGRLALALAHVELERMT